MLTQRNIVDFRKEMIRELHDDVLYPFSCNEIKPEEYYAVAYVNNYYIGRVLEVNRDILLFLHKVGFDTFNWPGHDDVDQCHRSCVFFGPVSLLQNGPFKVGSQPVIEKLFKIIKKKNLNFPTM